MKYKNKNISSLSQWCVIQFIENHKEVTNKRMTKAFNCSKGSINDILYKLKQKEIVQGVRSSEPGRWREVIYTLR